MLSLHRQVVLSCISRLSKPVSISGLQVLAQAPLTDGLQLWNKGTSPAAVVTGSITAGESKLGHYYQHESTLRSPSHSSTPPNYHKLNSSSRVMEVTCPPLCPWKVSASFDEEPRAPLLRTIVLTARVQCLAEIY